MATKQRVEFIFEYLKEHYEHSTTELKYSTPFQLLVAVILSAQCTDKRVNLVTPALFARFPDAQSMSKATLPQMISLIKSINFFNNKAKNLIGMAKALNKMRNEKTKIITNDE